MVELDDFIRIQITDVLKLVLFILILRLLDSETKIISLFAFFLGSVLLLASSNSPDFVNLGSLSAWDHLGMLVLDG